MSGIDRRKQKDKIIGVDSIGRPVYASSIAKYKDLAQEIMMRNIKKDTNKLLKEYNALSMKAAVALSTQDISKYKEYRDQTAQAFYALRKQSFLLNNIPKKRHHLEGWVDKYYLFRNEYQLGKDIPDEKRFYTHNSRLLNSYHYKEATRGIKDAYTEMKNASEKIEEKGIVDYDEAMRNADINSVWGLSRNEMVLRANKMAIDSLYDAELPRRVRMAKEKGYERFRIMHNGVMTEVYRRTRLGRKDKLFFGVGEDNKYHDRKDDNEMKRRVKKAARSGMAPEELKQNFGRYGGGYGGYYDKVKNRVNSAESAAENFLGVGDAGSLVSNFRPTFGPFTFNTGKGGLASVSVRTPVGAIRVFDKGSGFRFDLSTVNLPGPISYRVKEGTGVGGMLDSLLSSLRK